MVRGLSRLHVLGAVFTLACGEGPAVGLDPDPADAAVFDAATDSGSGRDASVDAGPQPGDPASGDLELTIFASLDPTDFLAVAEIRHGDRLYWQCGGPGGPLGLGHIWASARLESNELPAFSEDFETALEQTVRLELVDENVRDNDFIAEVNGVAIESARDLETAVEAVESGSLLRFYVTRFDVRSGNAVSFFAVVRVP